MVYYVVTARRTMCVFKFFFASPRRQNVKFIANNVITCYHCVYSHRIRYVKKSTQNIKIYKNKSNAQKIK